MCGNVKFGLYIMNIPASYARNIVVSELLQFRPDGSFRLRMSDKFDMDKINGDIRIILFKQKYVYSCEQQRKV